MKKTYQKPTLVMRQNLTMIAAGAAPGPIIIITSPGINGSG